MEVVNLELSDKGVLTITAILVILFSYGVATQNFIPLRVLLFVGMFFAWSMVIEGVIVIVIPSYADLLSNAEGASFYIIKMAITAISLGLFLVFTGYSGIEILPGETL